MTDKVEVKVEEGVKTLVLREGDAEVIHQNEKVEIEGTISAPWKFFKERMMIALDGSPTGMTDKIQHDMKLSHLVFSYQRRYVNLIMVENNPIKYIVKGKLIENPDIKKLQVNTGKKFTSKELCDLLRMNKFFFADKDQNGTVIQNLQKIKVSIQTQIEKEANDKTGDKRDLYDVKVNRDQTPLEFNLSLPIYVGQPATKFKVDINIDVRDRNIDFWLESPELAELLEAKCREVIDAEVKQFEEKGLVIIEQ